MTLTKKSYLLIWLNLFISCNSQIQNNPRTQSKAEIKNNLQLSFTSGVLSIFEDSKGNFWFGSDDEGVCLFDGKSFRYFTVNDGLSDNQVRRIQEDDKGNIWFGTGNGVSSYNGINITNHTKKELFTTFDELPNEWAKSKNDLWFNVRNSTGVYRYDGQAIKYLEFPEVKQRSSLNKVYYVTDFSKGKNNQIWMATYSGIFGYNGYTFKILTDESIGTNYQTGYLHIRSILEDSKGNLWIGNNGIGVLLYDGDTTINFSKSEGLISENSLLRGNYYSPPGSLEHVFTIEEDKDGNIWFGDRDTGAWKYDRKSMTNYVIDEALKKKMIYDIYQDKNGNLLFGMTNGAVYIFKENSFERKY